MDPLKLAHAIHVEKVYKSCHDSMQIATERCLMPKVIKVQFIPTLPSQKCGPWGPWTLDPTGVCKRAKMGDQTLDSIPHH